MKKKKKSQIEDDKCINSFLTDVDKELIAIRSMLLIKNAKYGNSALEPKRIFSTINVIEQLNVRMDDKLSRIANAAENNLNDDEDAELDLIGYLILKRIVKKKLENLEYRMGIKR